MPQAIPSEFWYISIVSLPPMPGAKALKSDAPVTVLRLACMYAPVISEELSIA